MGAITTLFKEGGIPRFYKGVSFAIVQNPLSRFGDTAANTGVLALMEAFFPGSPVAVKTALASVGGASWRIALTPVDTFKTTLQVQGNSAFLLLKQKVASGGILQLYSGASANFVANWVGNYPWCVPTTALSLTECFVCLLTQCHCQPKPQVRHFQLLAAAHSQAGGPDAEAGA